MNTLRADKRAAVVRCLVEGNSIRSTVRITGVAKNTVAKLLIDLGLACADYQDRALRGLTCKRLQCDDIWSFVYAKKKNVREDMRDTFGVGDVWTWTAIDADTKLIPSWWVGERDGETAKQFIGDVAARLTHRVQLRTAGLKAYIEAVEDAFGADIDYGVVMKLYGPDPQAERRYSPAQCIAVRYETVTGKPDMEKVSTSYVERQNLTMRMGMRRFTRLTNAFSKKLENHAAAIALHFMYCNFGRSHQSLRNPYPRTPAMAAGVADHVWSIEEIVNLLSSD